MQNQKNEIKVPSIYDVLARGSAPVRHVLLVSQSFDRAIEHDVYSGPLVHNRLRYREDVFVARLRDMGVTCTVLDALLLTSPEYVAQNDLAGSLQPDVAVVVAGEVVSQSMFFARQMVDLVGANRVFVEFCEDDMSDCALRAIMATARRLDVEYLLARFVLLLAKPTRRKIILGE